jgi:hypothetical protein
MEAVGIIASFLRCLPTEIGPTWLSLSAPSGRMSVSCADFSHIGSTEASAALDIA